MIVLSLILLVIVFLLCLWARNFSVRVRESKDKQEELKAEMRSLKEKIELYEEYMGRQGEDLLVLTHVILERGVADEDDMEDIRHRCVEVPLRRAEERSALLGVAGGDISYLHDDDEAGKIH